MHVDRLLFKCSVMISVMIHDCDPGFDNDAVDMKVTQTPERK